MLCCLDANLRLDEILVVTDELPEVGLAVELSVIERAQSP
jgi:hypothetical protein